MQRIAEKVNAFVARLVNAQLAEMAGDLVHLTLLGKACGSSSLSFESALLLVELLRGLDLARGGPLTLLAVVQMLPEMDGTYTPVMKRGRSESKRVIEASHRFGGTVASMLRRYVKDEFEYWARCKRAALLYDWMEGMPLEQLEKEYSTTPFQGAVGYGDIIRIADATRFHLRSAHRILSNLMHERPEFIATLDQILQRLEFGLPEAALSLMDLPIPLTRGQYLELWRMGCCQVADYKTLKERTSSGCWDRRRQKSCMQYSQSRKIIARLASVRFAVKGLAELIGHPVAEMQCPLMMNLVTLLRTENPAI